MNDERRDTSTPQRRAVDAVLKERDYQTKKWGEHHDEGHSMEAWAVIMSVYSGKVARTTEIFKNDEAAFVKRVTQLAAICLAALEATDNE